MHTTGCISIYFSGKLASFSNSRALVCKIFNLVVEAKQACSRDSAGYCGLLTPLCALLAAACPRFQAAADVSFF